MTNARMNEHKKENFYITYFLDALISERSSTRFLVESYRSDLYQFNEFLLKSNTTLIDANKTDLKNYVEFLRSHKHYKNSSISRKISSIKNFYKCLFNDGIINSNPASADNIELKNPKTSRPLPKYLSVNEIISIVDMARKLSDKEASNKRLCLILDILYSSGIRISELINIKLHEVLKLINYDDKECYIIIKGKGGIERQILFNKQAVDSLKSYLSVRNSFITSSKNSEWLFPGDKPNKPITRQRVGQLLKNLARQCNIDDKRISPHVFRHSFATHLLDSGANIVLIQKVLGHTNLSTTQIYTHVANEKLKRTLINSHPITQIIN
ncbi:recombinase XerD [Wolbachia pipientis]|uniref:Recombinase XerD n=1 Tax=Wolbachia pipientis TaxID=955 RepID=A0A1E7QKA2_WOLPI|nr:tyrosine-type recombinase/integrase [Wolbachia pipientis]OEY86901.1 recombinase XerD [Wolbachia pipientis]